jgi:hypothetical protein
MYPNLEEMVAALARDNGCRPAANPPWPNNAAELEALAAALTESERLDLAVGYGCGEAGAGEPEDSPTVTARLTAKYGAAAIAPLEEFVNDVFDGELSEGFLRYPGR